MKYPVVQYNKGSFTFTLSSPKTDPFMFNIESQLVSAAIKLMTDIEMKAELARVHLDEKMYWLWDDKNKLWCSFEDRDNQYLVVHFTDAIDPEKDRKQYIHDAVIGMSIIDGSHSYGDAVKDFQKDMMKFYGDNPQAFYLRYWRIKLPNGTELPPYKRGNLVFASPGDRQSKVKFEEDLLGSTIEYVQSSPASFDGEKTAIWGDEIWGLDHSIHPSEQSIIDMMAYLRKKMGESIGIPADLMGAAAGPAVVVTITKDNHTKK